MEEFWARIVDFFTDQIWEPGRGDFWGGIMMTLVMGLFFVFRKRVQKISIFLGRIREETILIPRALIHYKVELDEETLRVNHSWKLEDQSMTELIVPINIHRKQNDTERNGLKEHLFKAFAGDNRSRFLLLGDAGSGKSVGMGLIAREIWKIKRESILLPVFLTFSDLKSANTHQDVEEIIVKNLRRFQFESGDNSTNAQAYVKQHLYEGDILLLLDGFDELEKSYRLRIGKLLNEYFQTYSKIPFVISCRKAVWNQNPNVFNSLSFDTFSMADFTPLEIRQFLNKWDFQGKKSSQLLAEIINEKDYLRTICTNPLMLTIIAFIYAQPKRTLPDNRVKFYAECVDALMEKWDNAKSLERANKFETVDKVSILSRIAYHHIINSTTTDQDIQKSDVLEIIGDEMRKLSRPVEKREEMLKEIVLNTELLVELPPDGFKFPHRTFMEYFSAKYFYTEGKKEELLNLYLQDQGKWEETLALYCGLNENSRDSDEILKALLEDFHDKIEDNEPNTFVFKALVESAKVNPEFANEVLTAGNKYLSKKIDLSIIESLGHIAANENWSYHSKARRILLDILNQELMDFDLQQVIYALVNVNDDEIQDEIFKYLDRINLSEFLVRTGSNRERNAVRLVEKAPIGRLEEIFKGLRDAGELEFLLRLITNSEKDEVGEYAAYALLLASETKGFFDVLDNTNIKELSHEKLMIINEGEFDYSWNRELPKTEIGKKQAILMSELSANYIYKNTVQNNNWNKSGIHKWFRFILSYLLISKGVPFSKNNLLEDYRRATKRGLLSYWRLRKKRKFCLSDAIIVLIVFFNFINLTVLLTYEDGYYSLAMVCGLCILSSICMYIAIVKNIVLSQGIKMSLVVCAFPMILPMFLNEYVLPKNNSIQILTSVIFSTVFCIILLLFSIPKYIQIPYFLIVLLSNIISVSDNFITIFDSLISKDDYLPYFGIKGRIFE